MADQCCANCVYVYWSKTMKRNYSRDNIWPVGPICSNHPEALGQLREVAPGGLCRNYRRKPADQPEGAVRRISLPHGQFVLVDAADYEWLNQYKWTICGGYVVRREKGKIIYMHREIMHAPAGMVVDHIDGTRQNNYRSNLRVCTRRQNLQNQPKRVGCASRFKGVFFVKQRGKWCGNVKFEGEYFRSKCFLDEIEAARAYDRLAVECFGEFAYLNFPEDWPPERRRAAFATKETITAMRWRKAERAQRREENRSRAKGKSTKAKSTSHPAA